MWLKIKEFLKEVWSTMDDIAMAEMEYEREKISVPTVVIIY